ncbi:hypothetical protein SERLA73DRAFT_189189 [Serpula lacrymans var. lacrymans S7.3]|uniref:Uncharacterized protein n=1 Tax=Serpula lacrymans var. lacrymans (strain S7.3) TaxID=936435 RepID=F8QD21_SERL3|nr:hypothetical protein SERLA73DRAFT_189189 [Serpula lacrymans var. lacrymans S7.3]
MSYDNNNQFNDQQFQGGRQDRGLGGGFDHSANFDPRSAGQDDGGQNTVAGSHGGSGYGQSGGYTGSGGRRDPGLDEPNQYGTDSGLAGSGDTQDVNVPGAGRMGGEGQYGQSDYGAGQGQGQGFGGQGQQQQRSGGFGSKGYERDNDEYDSGLGGGAGAQGDKPGLGDKMRGGMEKMAGKVIGKSDLAERGQERQVSWQVCAHTNLSLTLYLFQVWRQLLRGSIH